MKEDFKKWLCKFGKISYETATQMYNWKTFELKILIKAMWAINDDKSPWSIEMNNENIYGIGYDKNFKKSFFKKPKQQALKAALQYIFDNKD